MWHLVRRADTLEPVVAYPGGEDARRIVELEVEHPLEAVPATDPRPLLGSPGASASDYARLAPTTPPRGLDSIRAFCGFDPAKHLTDDGRISPIWETSKIVRFELPEPLRYLDGQMVRRVAVHEQILPAVALALQAVRTAGLWDELEPYGGGFVPRFKRTTAEPVWSTHAFGLALDFNPAENPLGEPPERTRFGSTEAGLRVVELLELHGFYWGGRFGRPDGMHFQFCRGY